MGRADVISSASNPFVKRMRKLRQRKHRDREGAFLVEGIAQVWRAIENGAPIESLVVAPDLLKSERAWAVVERERARGTRVVALSRELFEETTEREHPSGLAAIVRAEERSLDDLEVRPDSVFVALEEVGNPGNLGSIVRSADATGSDGVVLVGRATDPHHPAAVKASMGTLFTVPVCVARDLDELWEWCARHDVSVVTTSARAQHPHWSVDYPSPCLLLFGSEAEGLSPQTLDRGDLSVRIPMQGSASSLNLAVSAGILLYEVKRRRERRGT